MLDVVFFGSSEAFSRIPLEAVAGRHRVRAVVQPERKGGFLGRVLRPARRVGRRILRPRPLEGAARRLGVPCWTATTRGDAPILRRLLRTAPDVICVAGYPWILPGEILRAARLGVLNVHPSLLPRHRGAMPWFWTYYHDDREGGVTVHWANERMDAGDIVDQVGFRVPRGWDVEAYHHEVGTTGARLLVDVLDRLERGPVTQTPQDERLATRAPLVRPDTAMVDFERWDVERVWHFLAGLVSRFREPLSDEDGARVRYERVLGFEVADHGRPVGSVQTQGEQIELFCRGGIVRLWRREEQRP